MKLLHIINALGLLAVQTVNANYLRKTGDRRELGFLNFDYDVVIIGGGIAGLAAAQTLDYYAEDLTYTVLEADDYLGGRIRLTKENVLGFGRRLEEGAVEIRGKSHEFYKLCSSHPDILMEEQDFMDMSLYDDVGTKITGRDLADWKLEFDEQEVCLKQAAKTMSMKYNNGKDYIDIGARDTIEQCGIPIITPLEKLRTAYEIEFEFCDKDTSLFSYPYSFERDWIAFNTKNKGIQVICEEMGDSLLQTSEVKLEMEVTEIRWDPSGVEVNVTDKKTGQFQTITARAAISTVAIAVLMNYPNIFDPPLNFTHNVYELTHYVKIFYRFKERFWDPDTEWILIAEPTDDTGCTMFVNLYFYTGQPELICFITTDTYFNYTATSGPDKGIISETDLNVTMLEHLRRAYSPTGTQDDVEAVYQVNSLNNRYWGDADYGNWVKGKTPADFDAFFEQGFPTLYLAGSASCPNHYELIQGGYFSGIMWAKAMLYNLFGKKQFSSWKSPPCH